MATRITQDAIDVAKKEAIAAILRNNTTASAYLCRWGNSRYLNFFFANDDTAAEDYRSRTQAREGKKLAIVGKVTAEEAGVSIAGR